MPGTRRKGVGIVEALILMIILGLAFSAIFNTLGWAQRTHISSRQDRESRELLFSWVQNFESAWRPAIGDTPAELTNKAGAAFATVARDMMDGTFSNGIAQIGHFTVQATPTLNDRRLDLRIVVRSADRRAPWVDLTRSFNAFSTDTVSDVEKEEP